MYIFTTEWKTFGFRVLTSSKLICLVMIFKIEKKKVGWNRQALTRYWTEWAEVSETG